MAANQSIYPREEVATYLILYSREEVAANKSPCHLSLKSYFARCYQVALNLLVLEKHLLVPSGESCFWGCLGSFELPLSPLETSHCVFSEKVAWKSLFKIYSTLSRCFIVVNESAKDYISNHLYKFCQEIIEFFINHLILNSKQFFDMLSLNSKQFFDVFSLNSKLFIDLLSQNSHFFIHFLFKLINFLINLFHDLILKPLIPLRLGLNLNFWKIDL